MTLPQDPAFSSVDPEPTSNSNDAPPRRSRWRRLLWATGLLILLVFLGVGFWSQSSDFRIFGQHTRSVAALVFAPDGKTLYSGCRDEKKPDLAGKVWDVATGREQRSIHGGKGITLSRDGRLAAVLGDSDQTIDIWDTETGTRRVALHDTPQYLKHMAISPDATTPAIAGCNMKPDALLRTDREPNEISLWNLANGERIRSFGKWDSSSGLVLSFSPDGKSLASCDWEGNVQLWDVASGGELASLASKEDRKVGLVNDVSFSPDGRYLAAAAGFSVVVWEVSTRNLVAPLSWNEYGPPLCVAFSPESRFLAAGGSYMQWNSLLRGCRVILWEVGTWKKHSEIKGRFDPGDAVWRIAFSPNGSRLAIGSYKGFVCLAETER